MGDQLALFDMPQTTRSSDDYWTPKWLFDALGLVFDIDVACPPEGPAHTPCKRFFTQADDGLAQPWEGLVFMNPPFSNTTPWVDKWISHKNGIALLPEVSRPWRNALFAAADGIVALPARMKFDVPDNRRGDIRYATSLYAIGKSAMQGLKQANLGRVH